MDDNDATGQCDANRSMNACEHVTDDNVRPL
jgi:hypothetical protein